MAAEVAPSPKRSMMDFFKTPPKVSDAPSDSKKSQGLLNFFTSTPRTLKPSGDAVASSSNQKKQPITDTEEIQIVETASKEEKASVFTHGEDVANKTDGEDTGPGGSQKTTTAAPGKGLDTSRSLKQTNKLKTNKVGKQRGACQMERESVVEKTSTKEDEKSHDLDGKGKMNQGNKTSEPEQMDYEEFKKTLLQGQVPQQSAAENGEREKTDELIQDVSVTGDQQETQNRTAEPQQDPNLEDVTPAKDSTNPESEQDKRQLRARTRKSLQSVNIPSPVLSPLSNKKDDSDLSLHGKDILEMTYEEYLKSIGAYDKSDTSNNESVNAVEQKVEGKSENTASTALSTPSIYNFFSKTTKSTKPSEKDEGVTKVTVAAVVHGEPPVNRAMAIKERAKNMLRMNKAAAHDRQSSEDEIEVLGSETIILDESASSSKSKCQKVPAGSEHQKASDLTEDQSQSTSKSEEQKTSTENAESPVLLHRVSSTLSSHDIFARKTQATLQFGKGGGLEMTTPIIKPSESATETPGECSGDEKLQESGKGKRKKPRKRRRIIKDDSDSSCTESLATETESRPAKVTPAVQSGQKTRLRPGRRSLESDSGNDSKDFTPRSKRASTAAQARAQELLMKARQQADMNKNFNKKRKSSVGVAENQKDCDKNRQSSSVATDKQRESCEGSAVTREEQSSRRQSSRLAQQIVRGKTAAAAYIDLETESESDDPEVCSPVKKAGRRRDSTCCTPEKGLSRKSPKKGKLAPIFTKLKAGDQEEKVPQPQEDPEVVRRRREFLMSGVPSELKRQAEITAQEAAVSEFAPFPDVSHVQQQAGGDGLDVWSLPQVEPGLSLRESASADEIPMSDLMWTSLQWAPTSKQAEGTSSVKLFTNQSGAGTIGTEQKEHLLREIQQTNPDITIGALYDQFKSRFDGTAQEAAAPQLSSGQSLEDSDVMVVDEKEEDNLGQNDRVSGCQWTETLQPIQASEIVGNAGALKRLRNWLEEWKMLIQKEARHTARVAANSSDFELSDSDGEEDSSQLCNTMLLVGPHGIGKTSAVYALAQQLRYKVFEVNASSSRQGRHILSQLQEATQSHQVAQRKDGVLPSAPPCGLNSLQKEDTAAKKEQKKPSSLMPSAFANFFKKASCDRTKKGNTKESPKKDSTRKRKRLPDPESESSSQSPKKVHGNKKMKGTKPQGTTQETAESNMAGCLNLTSTSLILFDEVDLVFEEDTGFLQTVQHFINTTKIPIVMTTADPGFGRTLSAKFEQLILKTPTLESVTSHLQTVLMAAGVRTSHDDVKALAATCHGDLRRALLTLQFFTLSGGGATQEHQPLLFKTQPGQISSDKNSKAMVTETSETCTSEKSVVDGVDSEDEFISLRPVRKPARRIIDEDNDSAEKQSGGDGSAVGSMSAGDSKEAVSADALPPVHLHLHNSLLGVSPDLQAILVKCLQDTYSLSATRSLVEQCLKLKVHRMGVVLPNLLRLLPLPTVKMSDRWRPPLPASTRPTRKRIRITDIYDSEASDNEDKGSQPVELVSSQDSTDMNDCKDGVKAENADGDRGVSHVKQEGEDTCIGDGVNSERADNTETGEEVPKPDVSCSAHGKAEESVKETDSVQSNMISSLERLAPAPGSKQVRSDPDSRLNSKLLSDFAHFYESLSSIDNLSSDRRHRNSPSLHRLLLQPGIVDTSPLTQEDCQCPLTEEVEAEVEVRSARRLWQTVDADAKAWKETSEKETLPDCCCIPLPSSSRHSATLGLQSEVADLRVPERYQTVVNTVVSNLPLTCYHSLRPVNLHYLPALRAITQAERNRQVAKTKRRFHHYFDNIGFCLNKPTMTALCEEFPASQDPGI